MDFSEKIYTVLKTNKLRIVTKEELSEFCGFNRDTIRKAIERGSELGDRYTRIFLDKLSINPQWWETGKGEIYLENPTSVDKADDNKEKAKSAEEIFRELIEKNSEYRIIPKSILDEEYRIVLKSEIDAKERLIQGLMEANKITIQAKNDAIEQLKKEVASLEARLPVVHTQKAQ